MELQAERELVKDIILNRIPHFTKRGLCCFPGLGTVGARGGRGEEALLLERQGRASQQTRSSSLPPPPSALPRPPRKPTVARTTRYDRLEHSRDARKDSDGSGSIASLGSRSSPLPYPAPRAPPSLPPSPRTSLLRGPSPPSPSPPRLTHAHARRASSASSARRGENNYRIQF